MRIYWLSIEEYSLVWGECVKIDCCVVEKEVDFVFFFRNGVEKMSSCIGRV